jgi:hypothetical protein
MEQQTKPRVISYVPIFYGKEYFRESILSMHDHVEQIHVFYTPSPSQGHGTNIPCPETEQELKDIAFATSNKIIWHNGTYKGEAEHRSEIYKYAEGFDLVFTLDSDEVVESSKLEHALKLAYESDKRYIGISGFINFWRSFNWCCLDWFKPIRIINLRNAGGEGVVDLPIYHFSTAQSRAIVDFKWNCSGHKNELRPNWVEEIYGKWSPENNFSDLHPTSFSLWSPIPFDKETLPEILKQHPNFNKTLI